MIRSVVHMPRSGIFMSAESGLILGDGESLLAIACVRKAQRALRFFQVLKQLPHLGLFECRVQSAESERSANVSSHLVDHFSDSKGPPLTYGDAAVEQLRNDVVVLSVAL